MPRPDAQDAALELFQAIAPDADEIEIKLLDTLQFFDCGVNLERINCPRCEQEVSIDWLQDRMGDDYDGTGFRLAGYPASCCGAAVRLDELRYEWPQAFARFGIDAMNPNIGKLRDEQRREFERILDTPVIVIYQHI